jgi:3-methyladenine DNA glycosylase AlkD
MQTVDQVMLELKKKADPKTRATFARHGAPADTLGVKIGDLKTIAKQIRGNQSLACALYETGNADAMYLAGMVADGGQMTKKQLESWAKGATWHMLSEYTVPGVVCESDHARDLAVKWIDAKKESLACTGWSTYAGVVATRPDEELDLAEIEGLLDRVVAEVHAAPNKVRYLMNAFVIAVGSYVKPLLAKAKQAAKAIGAVEVDMGDTACKVPLATAYIEKVEAMGRVGRKRKSIKC